MGQLRYPQHAGSPPLVKEAAGRPGSMGSNSMQVYPLKKATAKALTDQRRTLAFTPGNTGQQGDVATELARR